MTSNRRQCDEPEPVTMQEIRRSRGGYRSPRRLGVAAGVLFALLGLAGCGDDDSSQADSDALAVSGEFIEAFNSGDADAMLSLLTSDLAVSEKYTGVTPGFEAMDGAFFEQYLAWSTAQGTTFTSPECAVTEDGSEAGAVVSCEFGWLYAPEKAVDATPVPTTLTLISGPEGISQLAFEYPPNFGLDSFAIWLFHAHKEDSQGVEYGDWSSVAEAERGGALRAQYVAEWAAWLEANGCTYLDSLRTVGQTTSGTEGPPEVNC